MQSYRSRTPPKTVDHKTPKALKHEAKLSNKERKKAAKEAKRKGGNSPALNPSDNQQNEIDPNSALNLGALSI